MFAESEIFILLFIEVANVLPLDASYFKLSAACVNVLMGLSKSLVLLTFSSPTFEALIPGAILLFVIAASEILLVVIAPSATVGKSDVPVKSPDSFIFPLVVASASATPLEVVPSMYLFIAFTDGYLISDNASATISFDLLSSFSFKLILLDKNEVSRFIRSLNIVLVSELFNLTVDNWIIEFL